MMKYADDMTTEAFVLFVLMNRHCLVVFTQHSVVQFDEFNIFYCLSTNSPFTADMQWTTSCLVCIGGAVKAQSLLDWSLACGNM